MTYDYSRSYGRYTQLPGSSASSISEKYSFGHSSTCSSSSFSLSEKLTGHRRTPTGCRKAIKDFLRPLGHALQGVGHRVAGTGTMTCQSPFTRERNMYNLVRDEDI